MAKRLVLLLFALVLFSYNKTNPGGTLRNGTAALSSGRGEISVPSGHHLEGCPVSSIVKFSVIARYAFLFSNDELSLLATYHNCFVVLPFFFLSNPALPNVTIDVLVPSQEQAQSTIAVEQGRPVSVRCSVSRAVEGASIKWYKKVDGVEERGDYAHRCCRMLCVQDTKQFKT